MALRICGNAVTPPQQSSSTLSAPVTGAFEQRLQQRQTVGVPSDAHSQALDLLARQQASNLQYLQLQLELGTPKHSVISNVLKARHDTVKNSISNIR
jgi:hypothetical protein